LALGETSISNLGTNKIIYAFSGCQGNKSNGSLKRKEKYQNIQDSLLVCHGFRKMSKFVIIVG
jgi:hypothetical protein